MRAIKTVDQVVMMALHLSAEDLWVDYLEAQRAVYAGRIKKWNGGPRYEKAKVKFNSLTEKLNKISAERLSERSKLAEHFKEG
jgi:hypothetical protein